MRVLLTFIFALALSQAALANPYQVQVSTDPAVIPVGPARLIIRVSANGQPVANATVTAIAEMPGMKMGERVETATASTPPGTYVAPAAFPMEGAYRATVTVRGPQGEGTTVVSMRTGQNTAPGSGIGFMPFVAVGMLGLVGFAIWRSYRLGMRPDWRRLLTPQSLGAVALIVVILGGAIYAVNHWRRPGSMTPIEAQVMDMNMPAPEGTLPVQISPAMRGPFSASVQYTGHAEGFVEVDIAPRIQGYVTWMPFYAGDRVRTGQVLARIDTSQIDPIVRERQAALRMASEAPAVARAEHREASAEMQQAEAEHATRLAAIEEARRTVEDAEGAFDAALADQKFAREQLTRSKQLQAEGVVSTEELQRDIAEARRADGAVQSARAAVERARAGVRVARAEMQAHMAHVRATRAAAQAAQQRVQQAEAQVEQARANLEAAETQRGYSAVRSLVDGIVTRRLVSPGTLANPGQALLKVAQIDRVRLQANVPDTDLARIRVGNPVKVSVPGGNTLTLRVTSVTPSLDPASRMGVVEALATTPPYEPPSPQPGVDPMMLPGPKPQILPGAFVTMDITTDRIASAVSIPEVALRRPPAPSEGQLPGVSLPYVWLAVPNSDGTYTVKKATVAAGASDGRRIVVNQGLSAGQYVVSSSFDMLRDGMKVTSVTPLLRPSEQSVFKVDITSSGYEPSTITVRKGEPTVIEFTRKTDATCGTEVVFPALGLKTALPLNQPRKVRFVPSKTGPISFTCGMNMLEGKVVVK